VLQLDLTRPLAGGGQGVNRDGRQTSSALVHTFDNTTLWGENRTYDAVGNVATENLSLPDGTDNSVYCYDSLNRLTWAGNNSTSPCGTISAGNLATAYYQQSFGYDTLDRLSSAPAGSYSYASGHLHGVSSICNPTTPCTAVYQASYDLSGNMICHTIISTQNCGTTPTGQVMSYDNAGRMTHWQDKPTSPSHQQDLAYDGEGNRVALKLDGTITYYLGQYSEVTGSTHTKYLQPGNGLPTVMSTAADLAARSSTS
jgi:hypothetical protein